MFNCKKNSELVSQSLDRELSMLQRMSMTMHGLMCGACRAYRRQLESLEALIKRHYHQPTDTEKQQDQTLHNSSGHLSQAAKQELQRSIDEAVDKQNRS